MRTWARVLQVGCTVGFLLDLALYVILLQLQNPYPLEGVQADRWESRYWVITTYAFWGLIVLLAGVAVGSRWLRWLEQRSKGLEPPAPDGSTWPPPITPPNRPLT